RTLTPIDGRLDGIKLVYNPPNLHGRGALGGKSGRLDLDPCAQLHHIKHLMQWRAFVEFDPEWPPHLICDKSADPLTSHDQSVGTQCGHRLADHSAAHPCGGNHFLLGRQPGTGRQLAARNVGGQTRHQLGRKTARRIERLQKCQIFCRWLGQRLDSVLEGQVIIEPDEYHARPCRSTAAVLGGTLMTTASIAYIAGAIIAAAVVSTSAFAQQKLVLKASDVHPAGYPTVVAVENLGKKLEAATNGRISVQMYPSMQLG